MVSHTCAQSVSNCRKAANFTQAQLAQRVNERGEVIRELEAGTYPYNAGLINRIEKALNCKIVRARKKVKK